MTYEQLQSIIPNDELHCISDCGQFFEDNEIPDSIYSDNEFIVFSNTVEYLTDTLNKLMANKVPFQVHYDELGLEYIVI
tara:strand:- start:48 stop:284 length:237 start_codon:yes stop_codon:yes gene_type:complete